MKKLSVIIVSYNEKEYLPQAIESCLNQRDFDYPYEILIGDDGSSDGSIDLIREYAEKYPDIIRYYVMDREPDVMKHTFPSIRVSNIIKRGMELSDGAYFSILSGDDHFCDLNKFQKQVEFLDQNPKYVADVSGYKIAYGSGEPDVLCGNHEPIPNILAWGADYVHVSAIVFRRYVYDGGFLLEHFCDDSGMHYSIVCAGKLHYRPEITFSYRQRSSSIMHEADRMELSIIELLMYEDCKEKGCYKVSNFFRFERPLRHCLKRHEDLSKEKYERYFRLLSDKPDSTLVKMKRFENLNRWEQIKLYILALVSAVGRRGYASVRVINRKCYKGIRLIGRKVSKKA